MAPDGSPAGRASSCRCEFFPVCSDVSLLRLWRKHLAPESLRGGLRVDFQREQARHGRNSGDLVADADAEHLADIGRWIGADQQDTLSGFGKLNR
jgi:hypothetical protein